MKRGDNLRENDLQLIREYGISRHRYRELKEFCLQYYEKTSELKEIYALSSVSPDSAFNSGVPGKPTENKAMRANQLSRDIETIDKALALACGNDVGLIEQLKRNVTLGIGYDSLGYVPCAARVFYKCRRKFFFLLDKEKK